MNNNGFWYSNEERPILNVAFENFWDTDDVIWEHYFKTSHCFLWDRWDVRYNPADADVVFGSIFNRPPQVAYPQNRPKIMLVHEPHPIMKNQVFDQFKAVISFSANSDQPNNIRIPYWVYRLFDQYASHEYLSTPLRFDGRDHFLNYMHNSYLKHRNPRMMIERDRFCGFVAGKSVPWRDEVIYWLSEYKTVDCGGSLMANLPDGKEKDYMAQRLKGREANIQKADFFGDRKFAIAMENTMDMPGYTTEKIIDAYYPASIPIYAGQMDPADGFNPKAFVNLYDFDTKADFMERIIRIDSDPIEELEMRVQPLFESFPEAFTLDAMLDLYGNLFER